MAVMELVANVEDAVAYTELKKTLIEIALLDKVGWMDRIMLDRVRTNLGGQVLNMRSGNLFSSARAEPATLSGSEIVGAVRAGGSEAPYGIYHEEGGKGPYVIRASGASVLAFMSQGKMMFAKQVTHPTIQKRAWFEPAAAAMRTEMPVALQAAVDEVLADG